MRVTSFLMPFCLMACAAGQTEDSGMESTWPEPCAADEDSEYSRADFVPPLGRRTLGEEEGLQPTDGAWAHRLVTARSVDGVHWVREEKVLADQSNVPDLVSDVSGRLFLYYTGDSVGACGNSATAVAVSEDAGRTWSHKYVVVEGARNVVDPDVVYVDGRFRLFFTGPSSAQSPGIHVAESTDGLSFGPASEVLVQPGDGYLDSTTFRLGETWHLFALGDVHATSADGLNFTRATDADFLATDGVVVSNPLFWEGPPKLVGFRFGEGLRSYRTEDEGKSWTLDEESLLAYDGVSGLESEYVKDPSISRIASDDFFMVYVTQIPDE